jgi:aldose 1-epimerase
MTGVSLRRRGHEFLALPGGVDALRAGHTAGLPLLAPWANRLGARRYRVGRTSVDLRGVPLSTDDNGLPIHGLLVGAPGWTVDAQTVRAGVPRVRASISVDAPAFPFPHRIEIVAALHDDRLAIATTVTPTGRRRVPAAFGWHPYLRVSGVPRARWGLRLPPRRHLALDEQGLPTGGVEAAAAEHAPIGRRTFDDLYRLGRDRRLAFTTDDGGAIELRAGAGYDYAQVWVPARRPFGALEPMAAPTDALGRGTAPLVAPGDAYTARFELVPS